MKIRKCRGCGAVLQNNDSDQIGYAPDENMEYCQRCFRLIHYDRQMPVEIEAMHTLDMLEDVSGGFIWLIDLADLETSLYSDFARFYQRRECLVVLTKADIMPRTLTDRKIRNYVSERLRRQNIRFTDIVVRRDNEEVRVLLESFISEQKQTVFVTGVANVGKSTFINWLLGENKLTVNAHPSTTLALNPLDTVFGNITDTVGLVALDSMQSYLDPADLKKVVPSKAFKPKVYQLKGDQSLAIGGLARVDVIGCNDLSAVVYCSDNLKCHRSPSTKADSLWKKHLNEDLIPSINHDYTELKCSSLPKNNEKTDICICGLGWISLSGTCREIKIYCDPRIRVISRKAMI